MRYIVCIFLLLAIVFVPSYSISFESIKSFTFNGKSKYGNVKGFTRLNIQEDEVSIQFEAYNNVDDFKLQRGEDLWSKTTVKVGVPGNERLYTSNDVAYTGTFTGPNGFTTASFRYSEDGATLEGIIAEPNMMFEVAQVRRAKREIAMHVNDSKQSRAAFGVLNTLQDSDMIVYPATELLPMGDDGKSLLQCGSAELSGKTRERNLQKINQEISASTDTSRSLLFRRWIDCHPFTTYGVIMHMDFLVDVGAAKIWSLSNITINETLVVRQLRDALARVNIVFFFPTRRYLVSNECDY